MIGLVSRERPSAPPIGQLLIDQGQQLLGSLGVAPLDGGQDVGDAAHGRIVQDNRGFNHFQWAPTA
jgi:hypothetical protein